MPIPIPLAMWFPIYDWQFWVSSLIVLAAGLWIARGLMSAVLPSRKKQQTKVTLTVQGTKPKK